MKTGFVNERTIEYVLANIINEVFQDVDHAVIYPHMGREGSNISKLIHLIDHFKMIGFFARRQKFDEFFDEIEIKINQEIIDKSVFAQDNYKIPFYAGFSLSDNFWTIRERIFWLNLAEIKHEQILNINSKTDKPMNYNLIEDLKCCYNDLFYVDNTFNIVTAIDAIKAINKVGSYFHHFFGDVSSYKPFYLFLKIKD